MFDECTNLTRANFLTMGAVFVGTGVFNGTDINSDGMYGFDGSTAQAYALANGHPFHLLQTISFNSQGGSAVGNVYQAAGQTIEEPTKPTRSGYDFGGWFETSACTGNGVSFPYTVPGDKLLYAKWNKIYTISFDSQGGGSVADKMGIMGSIISEPIPTRSGYQFGGWFETSACTGTQVSFPYSIAGNKLLYAKWNKIYTISFDSQGGSSVADKTGITGSTISEPIPTKSGYEFGGWFETSSCTGNSVSFPYTISGNATLYAKWESIPEPTPSPTPTPTNTPIENPETGKPIPILYTVIFIGAIAAIGLVILWRSKQLA